MLQHGVLADLRSHDNALEMNGGYVPFEGRMCRADYQRPGIADPRNVYNLGGDLASFAQFIFLTIGNGLMNYATL